MHHVGHVARCGGGFCIRGTAIDDETAGSDPSALDGIILMHHLRQHFDAIYFLFFARSLVVTHPAIRQKEKHNIEISSRRAQKGDADRRIGVVNRGRHSVSVGPCRRSRTQPRGSERYSTWGTTLVQGR
jgi:hypothetical protein